MPHRRFTFTRRITVTHVLLAVLAIILIVYACDGMAATQAANFKSEVGISGYVVTTTDTAVFLVVPAGAEHAHITVETAPACFGDNIAGTAPTTTNSGKWLAGSMIAITNDPLRLKRLRLISCSTGAASTVQIYFSRSRRTGDAQ